MTWLVVVIVNLLLSLWWLLGRQRELVEADRPVQTLVMRTGALVLFAVAGVLVFLFVLVVDRLEAQLLVDERMLEDER